MKHLGIFLVVVVFGSLGCISPLRNVPDAASDAGNDMGADSGVDSALDSPVDSPAPPQMDSGQAGTSDVDGGADFADSNPMDAGIDTAGVVCTSCTSWGMPDQLSEIPSALPELSGLATSQLHPGILYTHNDSGDTARFFAINQKAEVNAEIHLSGVTATDWEDINVGPCPSGSCVYVGDTGDNKLERNQLVIYRVPEPDPLPTDGSIISVTPESFPFIYPDGRHNAETILVHPITGQIFIVIKETGIPATVYEMPLPLQPDVQVTLTLVTSLAIPPADGIVTDGSFHPCGDRLLIRTTSTTGLYEMTRAPGDSMASLFGAPPVMVPVAVETQGEAVSYAQDGRSYFTSGETVYGSPPTWLSQVDCQAP
jgi:hypothetical protein